LSADALQVLLRPSGTYRLKARRLTALARWWADADMDALAGWSIARLRAALLDIPGIGPETAVCIALYAFRRPVFVADGYARRLLHRLGAVEADAGYEQLRTRVEAAVPADPDWLNEAHAVIVAHGQRHCRQVPRCEGCAVRPRCRLGRRR
jgi:endonuclease-3 related protein